MIVSIGRQYLADPTTHRSAAYLDGGDVGVLRHVLVRVQSILGGLALLLLDAQVDEQEHHGLQRGDGDISGTLGGDVLVKKGQSSRLLLDENELMGALENVLGFLVRRRRLYKEQRDVGSALRYHSMRTTATGGTGFYR